MATIRNLIIRISVSQNTDKGIRRVNASLQRTNRQLNSVNKDSDRFSRMLSKLGRSSLSGLTGGLSKVASFSKAAVIGLTAIASAAASINTVVQAGGALAPLTGGLLLLPAAALGAAAAMGTLTLATSGVKDAMKAAISGGDPKDLADAIKGLAPAAKATTVEVARLRPQLRGIQQAAQQAVFRPLVGQLTAVTKVLAGPLKVGVAQVGNQFGLAGRRVAEFARQAQTVKTLQLAFVATGMSIRNLSPAIQPVLAGMRSLAAVGLSFLPGLATSAGSLAARFGQWAQQVAASGRAAQWIANALATLKQLGGVVVQVGGILKSVLSAASAAGSGFIGVLGAALAKLNAFLKTAQGQAALQSIFQALAAIGATLGPVIASIVGGLGQLAAPIGRLATMVGPILTTAIQALAPALAALEPGIASLLQGLSGAITAIAPVLKPLAQALGQIGVALAPILPMLGQFIGQLGVRLAPLLGQLIIAIGPLVGAFIQLLGALSPLIPPVAVLVVQLVQGLVPVLTPLIALVGQIAGVIGQFLVGAFQQLVPVVVQLLPVISQVVQTLGAAFLQVLVALAPALLQLLQSLLPLLPAVVQLLPPLAQIVVALTPIITLVIKLASAVLRVLVPILVYLITVLAKLAAGILTGLAKAITWLVSMLGRIGGWVVGAFKGAGKWLYNIGKTILIGLWNGIAAMGSWVARQIGNLVKAIIPGPIRAVLGIHSPSRVTTELGRLTGQGLAVGMVAATGLVQRAAGGLAQAAVPAIPGTAVPVPAMAAAGAQGAGAAATPSTKTLADAIKAALHGVTVQMDGKPVGQIVSRQLGRQTDQRRRTG